MDTKSVDKRKELLKIVNAVQEELDKLKLLISGYVACVEVMQTQKSALLKLKRLPN